MFVECLKANVQPTAMVQCSPPSSNLRKCSLNSMIFGMDKKRRPGTLLSPALKHIGPDEHRTAWLDGTLRGHLVQLLARDRIIPI